MLLIKPCETRFLNHIARTLRTHELPHTHPQAAQRGFGLSGILVRDNGSETTAGEGNYVFEYRPKGTSHGPPVGSKLDVTIEVIIMQYFDGPPTKLNEGETKELILE